MKVIKTAKSKFGWYIQLEDQSFKGCSEQVSKFLSSQIPCEINVESSEGEGNRAVITRVKVIGTQKQESNSNMGEPVETVKPGFTQANEYKPNNVQESIVTQFSIREGIKLIEVFNQMSEEKIKPTKGNIYNNSKIIKEVYDKLMNPEEVQDY